ncbi:HPr family phosphocarrier protein [Paenibacillus validus]|uniref:HPr family phosphocarrier protein n=1 Tax=Paenibacillus validus TaxID=44253 RepID=A0A7X2Z7B6_9BACL|nr:MULTISPECIES: HPr family phosphocarrier protein [Paenibacillus]MED4602562.1 HPr family phosphocarrier protein [Paenibacillus validus]MED4606065.1 HPr family phosphocarrier protein [Paenibacillus validus]MUG69674.1 HPr family phosphocarrier protein [Paenibacillus validus]
MISQTFTVINPTGFHVRPSKEFVQTASAFPCKINVINKDKKANGKSSISMLTLGIAAGDQVVLEIDGEQEAEAMEKLGALLVKIYE